jgi:uncharacterized protein YlzI (FlbEa/FlbD family)
MKKQKNKKEALWVKPETKKRIYALKIIPRESVDSVINRILELIKK